jgi:hypothetical protein
MDRASIVAHGTLLALLASVLEAAGITTRDEFARLLSLFAATVAETEPDEGEILALWAATIGSTQPTKLKQ